MNPLWDGIAFQIVALVEAQNYGLIAMLDGVKQIQERLKMYELDLAQRIALNQPENWIRIRNRSPEEGTPDDD